MLSLQSLGKVLKAIRLLKLFHLCTYKIIRLKSLLGYKFLTLRRVMLSKKEVRMAQKNIRTVSVINY